jgi:hypothetical protein
VVGGRGGEGGGGGTPVGRGCGETPYVNEKHANKK